MVPDRRAAHLGWSDLEATAHTDTELASSLTVPTRIELSSLIVHDQNEENGFRSISIQHCQSAAADQLTLSPHFTYSAGDKRHNDGVNGN